MNLLRVALLGLAALVAVILGFAYWGGRPDGSAVPGPQEIAASRRAVERLASASPDYGGYFDALKTAYPSDYEAFLARASERPGESGDVDALAIEAARGLRRSHGVLAARADGAALDRYFDARRAILGALAAQDRRLCVDFLYGGGHADFVAFARAHRPLLLALAQSGLAAIKDGAERPERRPAPQEEDFRALENALRAQGLSNAAIGALLDGRSYDPPLGDDELCQAGETYLKTLAALPQEARWRIYAFAVELMARS